MTSNECKKDKEYKQGRRSLRQHGLAVLSLLLVFVVTVGIFLVLPAPIEAITLKELGNAIAKLDSEQEKLLEEIVASETMVAARKMEIESLGSDLEILQIQLIDFARQQEEMAKDINNKKELLADRMIFTYKYGNNDVAKFIISAKNLNEIVNNLFLFKNIMSREAELIQELRFEKEEFDRLSRKSEEKILEIGVTRASREEEREKLKDCVLHLLFPERQTRDDIKNEITKIHREQLQSAK